MILNWICNCPEGWILSKNDFCPHCRTSWKDSVGNAISDPIRLQENIARKEFAQKWGLKETLSKTEKKLFDCLLDKDFMTISEIKEEMNYFLVNQRIIYYVNRLRRKLPSNLVITTKLKRGEDTSYLLKNYEKVHSKT